jgi:hypothetical protein
LLLLRPQTEMILLLSGQLPPLVLVLIAVPLRLLFHVAYYELGRWSGTAFVTRSPAGRWALAKARHPLVGQVLLLSCLVHQSTPVDLTLGARATPRRMVIPMLATGVLVSTLVLVYLGKELGLSRWLVKLLLEHRTVAAGVLLTVAAAGLIVSVRRLAAAPSRQRSTPDHGDEDQ